MAEDAQGLAGGVPDEGIGLRRFQLKFLTQERRDL